MRLGLNIQIHSDDRKSEPTPKMVTTAIFLKWINSLPSSEMVKDKFRQLVYRMPSTAYYSVIQNVHSYLARYEEEVSREQYGLLQNQEPSDISEYEPAVDDSIAIEENISLKTQEEINVSEKVAQEEEWEEVVKQAEEASGDVPGTRSDQGGRSDDVGELPN